MWGFFEAPNTGTAALTPYLLVGFFRPKKLFEENVLLWSEYKPSIHHGFHCVKRVCQDWQHFMTGSAHLYSCKAFKDLK